MTDPRQHFRFACGTYLARHPIAEPSEVVRAIWGQLSDTERNAWVMACGLEDVRRAIARTELVGIDDPTAGSPRGLTSSLRVARPTNGRAPVKRVVSLGGWRTWLSGTTPPLRLALMRRDAVLIEVDRLKSEGLGHLKEAAVLAAIAARLGPGELVRDRITNAEWLTLIADVDNRAEWVRVDELAALPAGEDPNGRDIG